jgi:hypothetical protein
MPDQITIDYIPDQVTTIEASYEYHEAEVDLGVAGICTVELSTQELSEIFSAEVHEVTIDLDDVASAVAKDDLLESMLTELMSHFSSDMILEALAEAEGFISTNAIIRQPTDQGVSNEQTR